MANSMQHWNGRQAVAVTARWTGDLLDYHELVEVCFLPLDSDFEVRRDVLPFNLILKSEHPRRFDEKASNQKRKMFEAKQAMTTFDPIRALDLFDSWVEKLDLKYTRFGNKKKLIAIGHNLEPTMRWISRWLDDSYHEHFDQTQHRDAACAALFLNDYAGMHAEDIKYAKTDIRYLCSLCRVLPPKHKGALEEALMISQIYKVLTQRGIYR